MRAAKLLLPLALLAVTGCSIKQAVTPATLSAELVPEICTIPAPGLRAASAPPTNSCFATRASGRGSCRRAATRGTARSARHSPEPGAGICCCT